MQFEKSQWSEQKQLGNIGQHGFHIFKMKNTYAPNYTRVIEINEFTYIWFRESLKTHTTTFWGGNYNIWGDKKWKRLHESSESKLTSIKPEVGPKSVWQL